MMKAAVTLRAKNISIIIVAVQNSYDTKCNQEETEFLVWFTISNRCKSLPMNVEHQDGREFDEFETLCQSKW